MRLSAEERAVIVEAARRFDPTAELWLFGSRADDSKRGGDIDIAIRSKTIGRIERMRIRSGIEDRLGEQKIDIVISRDGAEPFFRQAIETGVKLDE